MNREDLSSSGSPDRLCDQPVRCLGDGEVYIQEGYIGMKKVLGVVLLVAILGFGIPGTSQAQFNPLSQLDLTAVKAAEVKQKGDSVYLCVTVVARNSHKQQLRLEDFKFNVMFESTAEAEAGESTDQPAKDGAAPAAGKRMVVGMAEVKKLDFPAATDAGPTETNMPLEIRIGANNPETAARVYKLFNLLGMPAKSPKVNLEGSGQVGMEIPNRGWVYQTMRADLWFEPSIKREFLLN
jgi:hypothetical protein